MIEKTGFFNELNNSRREIKIEENYFNNSELFVLLSINGLIDTYNSNDFMSAIIGFCNLKERKVLVLNIKSVNYMSSTGIGAFVQIHKYCFEKKIKLYIMDMNKNVEEVFSLLGFQSFFNYIVELKDIKKDKIIRSRFPYKFKCPYCEANLIAQKPGKFKCSQCQKVFRVTEETSGINIITNVGI